MKFKYLILSFVFLIFFITACSEYDKSTKTEKVTNEIMDELTDEQKEKFEEFLNQCNLPLECMPRSSCPRFMDEGQKNCPSGQICCLLLETFEEIKSRSVHNKCALPSGIACVDFDADLSAQNLKVVLRNDFGFDMKDVVVSSSDCTSSQITTLDKGDKKTFTLSNCGIVSGQTFDGQLEVTYTNTDTLQSRKVRGSIIIKIE